MSDTTGAAPTESAVALSDGARIVLRRWGAPGERRMVVSHGNGLAVEGFRAFGAALEAGFEVIAFDMRNHGDSGPGEVVSDPWPRFLQDIPEIFDSIQDVFGQKPTHGAFHSLSAAATLMAQGLTARPWQSLTLYEPPVPPVADAALLAEFETMNSQLANRARARRRHFTSPDRLVGSFRKSPSFGGIDIAALQRLAGAMLRRDGADPNMPWALVCDPQMEANVHAVRDASLPWAELAKVDCPVQIVLGSVLGHDMPPLLRSVRFLVRHFGFDAATVAGGGHLMQLQIPARSAELAARFADRASGLGTDGYSGSTCR